MMLKPAQKGSKVSIAFVTAVFVSVCAGCSAPSAKSTNSGPFLIATPEVIDLGMIGSLSPVKREISLKNIGNADVYITEIRPGCRCTAVSLDVSTVHPGDELPVLITCDPRYYSGQKSDAIYIQWNSNRVLTMWFQV